MTVLGTWEKEKMPGGTSGRALRPLWGSLQKKKALKLALVPLPIHLAQASVGSEFSPKSYPVFGASSGESQQQV